MTADTILQALDLPAAARVGQRVPKKLLVEKGAPTPADKRRIKDGLGELFWQAALKPHTLGIPAYRDDSRDYPEIAVLSGHLRGPSSRLIELIHRAIPYPTFLLLSADTGCTLSLAHLRWSQGEAGTTVLDGEPLTLTLDPARPPGGEFLAALGVTRQPRQHLLAFYEGWMGALLAQHAAAITGGFRPVTSPEAFSARREALASHQRLTTEIARLRKAAATESQLPRQVEINLRIKKLEAQQLEAQRVLDGGEK